MFIQTRKQAFCVIFFPFLGTPELNGGVMDLLPRNILEGLLLDVSCFAYLSHWIMWSFRVTRLDDSHAARAQKYESVHPSRRIRVGSSHTHPGRVARRRLPAAYADTQPASA